MERILPRFRKASIGREPPSGSCATRAVICSSVPLGWRDNKTPGRTLDDQPQRQNVADVPAGLAGDVALGSGRRGAASSQRRPYPNRPVRIIVPAAPGGPTDVMARVISPGLNARL